MAKLKEICVRVKKWFDDDGGPHGGAAAPITSYIQQPHWNFRGFQLERS